MKTSLKLLLSLLALLCTTAFSQEDVIRKTLAANLPKLPKIDEVSKSPISGLFEVRIGTDIYYTDATGTYLIDGQLIETKTSKNLTEERVNKLTAIAFKDLPTRDAFTIVRGNGQRKMAVFEDPNCGYCKRFEADLQKINNVTVYMFLYPILGDDSFEKSKNIWCAPDRAKAWQDWMLRDSTPRAVAAKGGPCSVEALNRNVELGKKARITGTPTILLADGTRIPGAVNAAQLEKALAQVQ